MDLGRITVEDPWAALVGLVAVVPLAAALLTAHRSRRVARALGLESASLRVGPAATAVLACLALAVAATRPVLVDGKRSMRADSEVVFIVDVSRSMLAAASPNGPTRLDRARAAVLRLRDAVPNVPAGVSGITDRVLPYSFPSPDRATFAEVVDRSVAIESPPANTGGGLVVLATSFDALTQLDRGFFSEGIGHRACVVVTDGESTSPTQTPGRRTCTFIFVQVGDAEERIYGGDRGFDARYRPDPNAGSTLEQLAGATGGRVWPVTRIDAVADALREVVDTGPTTRVPSTSEGRSLAAYPAGLALALTVALAIGAVRRRHGRPAAPGADAVPLSR